MGNDLFLLPPPPSFVLLQSIVLYVYKYKYNNKKNKEIVNKTPLLLEIDNSLLRKTL